jgi:hypothetical protein
VAGIERRARRPVVVLSQDLFNERSGTIIAMAITGQEQRAQFPLTLPLCSIRLPKDGQGEWASAEGTGPDGGEPSGGTAVQQAIAPGSRLRRLQVIGRTLCSE